MYCPFGNRCQYRHIISEKRILRYSFLNKKFANDLNLELVKESKENEDFEKALLNVNLHESMLKSRLSVFKQFHNE